MAKDTEASKGVRDAWDFWLSQHDVSVPDIIALSIKGAFTDWLNAHTDEIIAAIAKRPDDLPPEA